MQYLVLSGLTRHVPHDVSKLEHVAVNPNLSDV